MCSLIHVCSVDILNNPAKLDVPYKLEITFEAFELIKDDVSWELIFVASDGDEKSDQVLDDVVISDVKEGRHKFTLECDAPKIDTLRPEDLMDVTLLLLKCKFRDQMFMKVGWFVTHAYDDPELIENPPDKPIPEKMLRNISVDDNRVTHYPIKWTDTPDGSEDVEENGESSQKTDNEVQMDTGSAQSQTSIINGGVDALHLQSGAGDEATSKAEKLKSVDLEGKSHDVMPFADVTNN